MFDEVDAIDWSQLEGSTGEAAGVPSWLRAVASDDAETAALARARLEDVLCHPSDRYMATATVISALLGLASLPRVHERGRILELVAHLVAGPCSFREGFEVSGVIYRTCEPSRLQVDRDANWCACYEAACGYVSRVLSLGTSGPDDVRWSAPFLLATLRTERGVIVPRLQSCFAVEHLDCVRAVHVFAIGMVSIAVPEQVEAFLLGAMQRGSQLVRVVAAMVYGWTCKANIPDIVVHLLVEGLCASGGELGSEYARLPFGKEGLAGDIGHVLAGMPVGRVKPALHALLSVLEHTRGLARVGVVKGLLHVGLDSAGDEERRGRATKAALLYSDHVWRNCDVVALIRSRGLPADREVFARAMNLSLEDREAGVRAFNEGLELLKDERVAEALESWKKAASLVPYHLDASLHIVWAMKALRQVQDGLAESERALAVFGQSADLHFLRADCLLALEQFAKAADACTRGLSINDTSFGRYTRASAYARLDKPDKAIEDLRWCLAAASTFAEKARTDPNLRSLHGREDFQHLLYGMRGVSVTGPA